MGFQLLIAVSHSPQRVQWEDVFRQIAGVTILDGDIQHLMRMSGLDALLMTGFIAHEHGNKPESRLCMADSNRPRTACKPPLDAFFRLWSMLSSYAKTAKNHAAFIAYLWAWRGWKRAAG